ncbi:hypothetical protein [Pedobacter sp.]|uniref:hypothetical protein n=1 Tax=Pedobacter sp. TaxID=1411316 RepID=UPI003BAD4A21
MKTQKKTKNKGRKTLISRNDDSSVEKLLIDEPLAEKDDFKQAEEELRLRIEKNKKE